MERFWFAAILVYASVSGATAPKTGPCSAQVSRDQVFVNIVASALKVGSIEIDDVRTFVKNHQPFTRRDRRIGNFEQQRTLDRLYREMTDGARAASRQSLRALLATLESEQKAIGEASESQKLVVHPRVLAEFRPDVEGELEGRFVRSQKEGRPVFFGQYRKKDPKVKPFGTLFYVMFDPFHPDPKERVKLLFKKDAEVSESRMATVLEWKGRSYYTVFEEKFLWDIDRGVRYPMSILGNPALDKSQLQGRGHVLVRTRFGLKLIATHADFSVKEYNLDHPETDPVTLIARTSSEHLRLFRLGDENVVILHSGDSIYARYVDRPGTDLVEIVKADEGDNLQDLIAFQDQGKHHLLYIISTLAATTAYDYRVIIAGFNSEEKKTVSENISIWRGNPILLPTNGIPRAMIDTNDGLGTVDLRAGKFETMDKHNGSPMYGHQFFNWRGNDFLVWQNSTRHLSVYALRNQAHAYSEILPSSGYVEVFEYAGLPYVMLAGYQGPTLLIGIMNPENK